MHSVRDVGCINNSYPNITTAEEDGKKETRRCGKKKTRECREEEQKFKSVISQTVWEEQKLSVSLTLTFGFLVENPLYHPERKHKHQWVRQQTQRLSEELWVSSLTQYARRLWLQHFNNNIFVCKLNQVKTPDFLWHIVYWISHFQQFKAT